MVRSRARRLVLFLSVGLLSLTAGCSSSDENAAFGNGNTGGANNGSDGGADATTRFDAGDGGQVEDASAKDSSSHMDAFSPDAISQDGATVDASAHDAAGDSSSPDAADSGQATDGGHTDPGKFCQVVDDPHELISDRRFRRGFIPLDQKTHKPAGVMPTGFCKQQPIWNIAQWDSLGDLSKTPRTTLSNGSVRWSNKYGRVTVGLLGGSDADISFGVWAYQEYGGQYHTPNPSRVWVHLLAEQRISPPGVQHPGCPPLSSLSKLNFKMAVQLLKDDPHYQAGYDKNKHAAQFLLYFTVQNLNRNSPGYGDYLWFGVMPYDDRFDVPDKYVNGDLGGAMGTGKLIYNLGAKPFITAKLKPGGPEQMFARDILPDIRDALLEAWKWGFLPDSKVLSDYRIGGMNIGWEVPGLNDVEMRVRDLSLRYETKPTGPVTFSFDKDGDREGWTAHNVTELAGGPKGGKWIMQVPGDDPYIVSPELNLDAAAHKKLTVVFANDHNPAASSQMRVYWERFGEPGFREAWSVVVPVKNDGGWRTVTVDLGSNPAWTGEITRIRIDPVVRGDGHSVGFDSISL